MKQPDSNWDKLINLPNEYTDSNPEIVDNTTKIINVKFENKKQHLKSLYIITVVAIFLTLIIFLTVFYLTPKKSENVFFDSGALEAQEINNIEDFKAANKLSFMAFDQDLSTYTAYAVKDSNQFAYIRQDLIILTDYGFDSISLFIPLIRNASFDFSKSFTNLDKSCQIENITVAYKFYENNNLYYFNSTFMVDKYNYYIEIETQDSQVEPLLHYLEQLIK